MSQLQHHSGALPAGRWLALVRRPGGLFRGLPGAEDSADGAGRGQAPVKKEEVRLQNSSNLQTRR